MSLIVKYQKKTQSLYEEIIVMIENACESFRQNTIVDSDENKVFDLILSAAKQAKEYSTITDVIKQKLKDLEIVQSIFRNLERQVETLEVNRAKREQYGERWCLQKFKALHEVFKNNGQEGFELWVQTYVETFVAWKLEICNKLANEPFTFPKEISEILTLFKIGTEAVISEHYMEAINMIDYLLNFSSSILEQAKRVIILIFIGRIYLYYSSEIENALDYFKQAYELDSENGSVYAAFGDYYRILNEYQKALGFYQQSIEQSHELPDGYLGMGLLAEDQQRWDEADEWFERAYLKVKEEIDFDFGLSKLLVPSGNLYLLLAKKVSTEDSEHSLLLVDRALDIGIKYKGVYPNRIGLKLKAELLEKLERIDEAFEEYFDAGQKYYWDADYKNAIELLSNCRKLKNSHMPTYWYLLDALRIESYYQNSDDDKLNIINQSLSIWEIGKSLALPDANYSWAYVTRALINERLADFAKNYEQIWALSWEAITFLEKAIILNREDSYRFAVLARLYRNQELEYSCLQATDIGIEKNSDSLVVLDERAAILSNMGKFKEAEEVINKRIEIEANIWAESVKAYLLFHNENYADALEKINYVIRNDESIWNYYYRAICYRKLDRYEEAEMDYEKIWSKYSITDIQNLDYYASALFWLTLISSNKSKNHDHSPIIQALEISEVQIKNPADRSGYAYFMQGMCQLFQGDLLKAKENMFKHVSLAINQRQLDDLDIIYLSDIEKFSKNWPLGELVGKVIKEVRDNIAERKIELEKPSIAQVEMEDFIKKLENENKLGTIEWIGANAGIARMYCESKNWNKAAYTYTRLLNYPDQFSEATYALSQIIDKIQTEGDEKLKDGKNYEALAIFEQALFYEEELSRADQILKLRLKIGESLIKASMLEKALEYFIQTTKHKPLDVKVHADLLCRITYVHFRLNNIEDIRKNIIEAINLYNEVSSIEAGYAISEIFNSLIQNQDHFWDLMDKLKIISNTKSIDENYRREINLARKSLVIYFDNLYNLSNWSDKSANLLPVVNPIAIEISQDLIPEGNDAEWVLFKTYLPEMRKQIQDEMGVKVPGIRIRGNETDFLSGNYIIFLDEVPIVSGFVPIKERYTPTYKEKLHALNIPEWALTEKNNPLSGEKGCWVKREFWEIVSNNNYILWNDVMVFIVNQLKDIILQNLRSFFGYEEVEILLDNWKEQNEKTRYLIEKNLSNPLEKLRFARILRMLIDEKVSIIRLDEIITIISDSDFLKLDINQIVNSIRAKQKKYLPGNEQIAKYIFLPSKLEDKIKPWIITVEGKTFFSIPPEETQDLLSEIRNLVDPSDRKQVLVSNSTELRPYIRRLVSLEFPYLMVIAKDELLTNEESLNIHNTDQDKVFF